jgi:hypothetical protein
VRRKNSKMLHLRGVGERGASSVVLEYTLEEPADIGATLVAVESVVDVKDIVLLCNVALDKDTVVLEQIKVDLFAEDTTVETVVQQIKDHISERIDSDYAEFLDETCMPAIEIVAAPDDDDDDDEGSGGFIVLTLPPLCGFWCNSERMFQALGLEQHATEIFVRAVGKGFSRPEADYAINTRDVMRQDGYMVLYNADLHPAKVVSELRIPEERAALNFKPGLYDSAYEACRFGLVAPPSHPSLSIASGVFPLTAQQI